MIDISEVKVYDRVRLTRKNEDGSEDTAEFTVTRVHPRSLRSATNTYVLDVWDALDPLTPPLPTKPGLYSPYVTGNPDLQPVWRLCADGTWLYLPYSAGGIASPVGPKTVARFHRAGTLRYLETGQEQ